MLGYDFTRSLVPSYAEFAPESSCGQILASSKRPQNLVDPLAALDHILGLHTPQGPEFGHQLRRRALHRGASAASFIGACIQM